MRRTVPVHFGIHQFASPRSFITAGNNSQTKNVCVSWNEHKASVAWNNVTINLCVEWSK